MYATNEGEEFIESVFYPNGIDQSDERRNVRVPRFLWSYMLDDIFDKGRLSTAYVSQSEMSDLSKPIRQMEIQNKVTKRRDIRIGSNKLFRVNNQDMILNFGVKKTS